MRSEYCNHSYHLDFNKIGKTVFLTKAEAEKALEGMKDGGIFR